VEKSLVLIVFLLWCYHSWWNKDYQWDQRTRSLPT